MTHTINKIFTASVLLSALAFSLIPVPAYADYATDLQAQLGATAGREGADIAESKDPRLVAALLIKSALTVLGTVFLLYTAYAGYLIMTAAGDDDQINQGKSTLVRSTIGVLIILSAYSITIFVTTKFIPLEGSQQFPDDPHEEQDAIDRAQQPFQNQDPLNQDINRFRR